MCDSWARVTVCPIIGKWMTLSKLWEKVFADYVENWRGPPTCGTPVALQSQFRNLKKLLKDWHNAQIKSRDNITSGTNMMNQVFFLLLYIINCNIILKAKATLLLYMSNSSLTNIFIILVEFN